MAEDHAPVIAVVGGAASTREVGILAFEVGRQIAARQGVLLCGGRGGVMEQAARGAKENGGTTLGVLPGEAASGRTSSFLSHRLFTGIGQARNQIIVLSAAAVIAVGGEWGTLSEIALALKHRVPVVLLESFDVRLPDGGGDPLLFHAGTPSDAVALAFEHRRELP
ncbi:MAG: TIGR00725 family protein [Thermoanaerobaculia bacterium]